MDRELVGSVAASGRLDKVKLTELRCKISQHVYVPYVNYVSCNNMRHVLASQSRATAREVLD